MTAPQITITPQRSALLEGHDNQLDVLVRIQAPALPEDLPPRQPLNLALVIDRSGSMSGQPLAEAKRCAAMIIENLDAKDMVSLVVYDNEIGIPVPFRQVGDRNGLRQAIESIHSGGTTALYDGWYEGAGQAAHGTEQAGVSRVLLLSDGQANHGLTDPAEIASRCAKMAEVGVTTSSYGLGHHFNEELMVQMARGGNGNSYYGQTAEAYQALASDPTVVERFGELHAADLQEKARRAARRGDWDRVDALLEEAKKNAADNPWLQGILEALQGYASGRETESLSKEAMYASRRIRSRLADVAQCVGDYDLAVESDKPMFLRRKNEQGKRF